jgi:hypothetical protein
MRIKEVRNDGKRWVYDWYIFRAVAVNVILSFTFGVVFQVFNLFPFPASKAKLADDY